MVIEQPYYEKNDIKISKKNNMFQFEYKNLLISIIDILQDKIN